MEKSATCIRDLLKAANSDRSLTAVERRILLLRSEATIKKLIEQTGRASEFADVAGFPLVQIVSLAHIRALRSDPEFRNSLLDDAAIIGKLRAFIEAQGRNLEGR